MTDAERTDLARQVAFVATDLDRRGYAMAGVIRCAARALLEIPETADDGACRGCGGPVPVRATGRPRVWCGETCRRRSRP